MADPNHVEQLLRQLDAQRDAYLNAFRQAHELLAKNLAATAAIPQSPNSPSQHLQGEQRSPRTSIAPSADTRTRKVASDFDTLVNSSASRATTGDETDSDSDDDENLYVQEPLPHQLYEHENLRKHLRSYKWQPSGRTLLDGIINDPSRMSQPTLFETKIGKADDRSHYSYLQVYDVGSDGAPILVEQAEGSTKTSNAIRIWETMKEVNQPSKALRAVGRISVYQEPSPVLLGAIHHIHNQSFDMDELFTNLLETSASSASFHRAFDEDPRRQRSFVFNMEYFTIIGKDCRPMAWQEADRGRRQNAYHINISRCSSVIALSLGGNHIKKVKNHSRQATNPHGFVYDPFAPYQVLKLECFPDWKSTHNHDSAKHYVNGVEAFLVTLLGEFRCAQQRFEAIYKEVSNMILPPSDFMFDLEVRDKLQFEDEKYTYTRRYFWAYQTLGIINDAIKAIIDGYEDTLVEDVWDGKHRTLWPLLDESSQRNQYYKKKMAALRSKFEVEMTNFRTLVRENDERRREIRGLREELFSGTSIRESRNSVKNTEVTIEQGKNIKLLTVVSMCFLPLTFVTSVFGMTNMPVEHDYWQFGLVTGTVCVPFFIIIGTLNTTKGMRFWTSKMTSAFAAIYKFLYWVCTFGRSRDADTAESDDGNSTDGEDGPRRNAPKFDRTGTSESAMMRLRRWSSNQRAELAPDETELEGKGRFVEAMRPVPDRAMSSRIAVMWSEESAKESMNSKQEV